MDYYPPLPTDSLYKFLAMAGVILLLTSLYPFTKISTIRLEIAEMKSAVREAEANTDRHKHFAKLYVDILKSDSDLAFDEWLALHDRANKYSIASQESINNISAYSDRVEILIDQAERWAIISATSLSLGLILTAVGFYLWYTLVQKPTDKLLRARVDRLQEEMEKTVTE